MVKQINVELKCLTKLFLDIVGPVILLVEVLVLNFFLLLDLGINELLVKYYHTTFAHCFEHNLFFTTFLSLDLDVLKGLELHVVDLNLLGKLENDWLVEVFSVTVHT